MTHVAEERDIDAPPDVIWPIVSDSMRWPEFYHTHDRLGVLNKVEYVKGDADALGTVRRMDFRLSIPWDEECVAFEPDKRVQWEGVRTPGMNYYITQIELIPGAGYTTLRWDLFFSVKAPAFVKPFVVGRVRRVLEDVVLTSLLEIDRLTERALRQRAESGA